MRDKTRWARPGPAAGRPRPGVRRPGGRVPDRRGRQPPRDEEPLRGSGRRGVWARRLPAAQAPVARAGCQICLKGLRGWGCGGGGVPPVECVRTGNRDLTQLVIDRMDTVGLPPFRTSHCLGCLALNGPSFESRIHESVGVGWSWSLLQF